MDSNKNLMTEGSYRRKIILFAIPMFFGNLFQQLYNAVDSLIVGNFVGSSALAAVTSTGNLIFLIIGFFNGLSVGAGVLVSRYIGARDKEKTSWAVHTTISLGLIFSVIMTAGGMLFTPMILRLMSTPPEVMADAISYLRIYFAGAAGFVMYNTFVGILQASGDSRHPLIYLIISSITNVFLDLLFVAGLKMGVQGAALATDIGQCLSALLAMTQLLRVKADFRFVPSQLRLDRRMLKRIFRYGVPAGLQNSIIGLSNVVIQSFINSFGPLAMAGIGAYTKIEGFAFLPVTSFCLALPTFVSQNIGARKPERAREGANFGIVCALVVAEVIGLVGWIFAPQLISLFGKNPEVIMYGVQRARIVTPFFMLVSFTHVMASILRGTGRSIIPMVVMLVCWCAVRIVIIAAASVFIHSIFVTYWVYPITWTLSATTLLIVYLKMDFKTLLKEQ